MMRQEYTTGIFEVMDLRVKHGQSVKEGDK